MPFTALKSAGLGCPNGAASSSPGLRGTSYLGIGVKGFVNPNGVASNREPQDATLSGEWRLHKAEPAQPGILAAKVALGVIGELTSGQVQPRVFVFLAFDGAGLSSARPLRHQ